jgi:hypothetical protein
LKKETCLAGFQGTPESRAVKAPGDIIALREMWQYLRGSAG